MPVNKPEITRTLRYALRTGVLAGVLLVMPVCVAARTDGTVSGDNN